MKEYYSVEVLIHLSANICIKLLSTSIYDIMLLPRNVHIHRAMYLHLSDLSKRTY